MVGRKKNGSFSSSDDDRKKLKTSQLTEQNQQMYAQLVYKDSKIVELSRYIDDKDRKVMDLQETCRELDEVIKAKTKAIQILQENLNWFISKKLKDKATQIDLDNEGNFANIIPIPGHAVACYEDQKRMDEEGSSFTTDLAANDIESFDLIRHVSKDCNTKDVDKLNNRLSGLLQEVEFMQQRVIKNEAEEFEKSVQNSFHPNAVKKKKDRRVTFDFSEQQRLIELVDLKEKLQNSDLACNDLRVENDELRLTIADCAQRLDESSLKNDYNEKTCSELKNRSEIAERDNEEIKKQLEETEKEFKKQLDETKKEYKTSILKTKAQQTSKVKQLEEEIALSRTEFRKKSALIDELEKRLTTSTDESVRSKNEIDKMKICIRNLTEELQKSFANVSQFEEMLKKSEMNSTNFYETIKNLEFTLTQSYADNELLTKQVEEQKRQQRNQVFKTKARLSVRIKELEEILLNVKRDLAECEGGRIALRHDYFVLEQNFRLVVDEKNSLLKQNQNIRKDLDELKQIIETSQEVIDVLEHDLQLSYSAIEQLRSQNETHPNLCRTEFNRQTSDVRLKLDEYSMNIQNDNEHSDDELVALMKIE